MENWRWWFELAILVFMGILGWMFGKGYHQDIALGDEVKLPVFFTYLFGKPNNFGEHNIRGIYWQILVVFFVVSFGLRDLGLITLQRAAQICGAFLFSLPLWELIRYLKRKVR